MSEIVAYGGFPKRYPHWTHGMAYEEFQRGYEYGFHKVYELVINNNPCYIYLLNSNTRLDNVTVICHATGHNDFFKQNINFAPTHQNMMNKMANHSSRVAKYMKRWGTERVMTFIDHVLRIESLIDMTQAWNTREIKEQIIRDNRIYELPRRLQLQDDHLYMDPLD